jgi:hypothetical protein
MVFTGDNFIFYMHDPYGRVCYEGRETGGDTSFSFTYEYNGQGQIKKINYPGGLSVNREYDAYGNLQKLLADNQPVWELTGETGTVTTTQLGGTLTATRTRNAQGLLTNLKTVKGSTLLHDMTYAFNGATGNLTSRSGMTGQTESFLYDNLDRLTQVNRGGVAVMDMEYSSNGNIDSKTGVGRYAYDHRPHAVDFVWNTDKLISANDQIITYTAFDKVSRITEKVGADDYQLDLTYGPDRQRWKSTLKKNGHLEKTTIVAGAYERITRDRTTEELYYICEDVIYVKQSGG